MIIFKISGHVMVAESRSPLPGLFIKAYDKDLLFDDLLGSAVSDRNGRFEIVSEMEDFREFFDSRPDIYFKVFRPDRRTLVHSTEDAVCWGAGKISEFEILIPGEDFLIPQDVAVVLTGEDGQPREEFEPGESLVFEARGLRPIHAYEVGLYEDERELFTSRLLSNAKGELESSVLWPQMGLDDTNSDTRYTPVEAAERWAGNKLRLVLASRGERISEQVLSIGTERSRPLVISSDREGRVLNGFEIGSQPLYLTMYNLRGKGRARIYMVSRQHDWREGDAFQPVVLANGRPAVTEIDLSDTGDQTVIEFAAADELVPGTYDFIIRPLRYGFEEDEYQRVIRTDIIAGRRVTGLVIREVFMAGKVVLGGCVNQLPVAGRSIAGAPYFAYADTFEIGEDVYAALDPGIMDPGNISKMCAFYVIPSKDGPAWSNNSLNHLAVLGGNAGVKKIKVQAGCVNANKELVWPSASQEGEYDIVADFGNNTSDAALFVEDHQFDTPLDVIDGYFVAGFRVVRDPGTMEDFTHAGNWNYTEADVTAMGLEGSPVVEDDASSFYTPGTGGTVNKTVPLKAHVYFPATSPGITDPLQIAAVPQDFPMVVVVHGNGHDYTTYDNLLEHLAKNGFIAASIDLRFQGTSGLSHGMRSLGRANVLFKHLAVLQAKFGTKAQNNIGIMGHSRGGEAVVAAARLNQQHALGHKINAVISLAPTDQYGSEALGGAWATPYFVLYGSRDGDISGDIWTDGYTVPQTGFALYDRASGAEKSMVFVYLATHNGFITTNYDVDPGDAADVIPPGPQQKISMAYMNAFFRQHLMTEPKWRGMFTGEWKPQSVEQASVDLYVQYRATTTKTVDNFEGAVSNWATSTIGGTVSHLDAAMNPTLPDDPDEDRAKDFNPASYPYVSPSQPAVPGLDIHSPHDTKALKVHWDNYGDHLLFSIPAADKDVSGYSVLSLRVTQKVDSPHNTVDQPQDFRVSLKDSSGNERAVRVSAFAEIPYPDHRATHLWSKSAMTVVRIPLKSFTIVCAGQPKVDLADLVSLGLVFTREATGEIEIDEIEFTN